MTEWYAVSGADGNRVYAVIENENGGLFKFVGDADLK